MVTLCVDVTTHCGHLPLLVRSGRGGNALPRARTATSRPSRAMRHEASLRIHEEPLHGSERARERNLALWVQSAKIGAIGERITDAEARVLFANSQ
jgi:hypothetical protein